MMEVNSWFSYNLLIIIIFLISNVQYVISSNNENDNICNSDSGWKSDYISEFSHKNGDHYYCDLDIISLETRFVITISQLTKLKLIYY